MLYRPRTSSELYCNVIILSFKLNNLPVYLIGRFRNERTTGAEMRSAIVLGLLLETRQSAYLLIFPLSLVIVPGDLFFLNAPKKACDFYRQTQIKIFPRYPLHA